DPHPRGRYSRNIGHNGSTATKISARFQKRSGVGAETRDLPASFFVKLVSMRELPHPRSLSGLTVLAVLAVSGLLFIGTHLLGNNHQSLGNWVLTSWPTLIALGMGMLLLEAGPLRSLPLLLRNVLAFFRYTIFYLAFLAILPVLGMGRITGPVVFVSSGVFFLFVIVKLATSFRFPRVLSGNRSRMS